MSVTSATRLILSRLLYLQQLRGHMGALYVRAADHRCVVRMFDLAQAVAARLGEANSPRLRADLRQALALDGLKVRRHCGRYIIPSLRRIDQSEADALKESRRIMANGTRRELTAYRDIPHE